MTDPDSDPGDQPGTDQPGTDQPASYRQALRHPSRRGWTMIVAGGTFLVLLILAMVLPVPFVKLAPGPTFNVIGEHEGETVIQISGTETFPVTGTLDMTTVMETGGPRGGLTFIDAVASWLDPSDAVVPRELLFPDDETGEEVQRRQSISFSTSQSDAIAAAMAYLERPTTQTIVVQAVFGDSPADGTLQLKDEILAVDGEEITVASQVAQAVRAEPPGTAFTFTVDRAGEIQDISVTSEPNPEDPSVPYIGIAVGTLYEAEFPITFTLEDVGGPSAGLMFATGIIDKLTPEDLVAGAHVAGTGTIAPDGAVGPIGGIRQKLAGARASGATLFLMPIEHCEEAADHVPDGLTVVPVETLTEGIDAIRAHRAGEPVAACPVAAT